MMSPNENFRLDSKEHKIFLTLARNTSDKDKKILFYEINELQSESSLVTDYPIAAYKSISPDNKEIVIMHLSHRIP